MNQGCLMARRKRTEISEIPEGLSRWWIEKYMAEGMSLYDSIAEDVDRQTVHGRLGFHDHLMAIRQAKWRAAYRRGGPRGDLQSGAAPATPTVRRLRALRLDR